MSVATGIGSMPGESIEQACAIVAGEFPDLLYLPELPARGPGSDLIGRTAAGLELAVELQPSGWRLAGRPSLLQSRSRERLAADIEAFALAGYGYTGVLKTQLAGPLTLAAGLELPRGARALGDPAARIDIADALAELWAAHLATLRRAFPGAQLIAQLDEPSLPAIMAGRIPTASGFGTVRALERSEAIDLLTRVINSIVASGGRTVVHCCAADPATALIAAAGADAISVDVAALGRSAIDQLGEAIDGGLGLFAGIAPALAQVVPSGEDLARQFLRWWTGDLGFATQAAAEVTLTPACGLAGADPEYCRKLPEQLRIAAARVSEEAS